jgi:hypothetical protein
MRTRNTATKMTTDIIRESTLLVVPHGVEKIQIRITTTKKKNIRKVPTPIIPNTRDELFVTVDAASSVPPVIASIARY